MSAPFDIHKILRLLPHRYPFLLVDRVVEITPGQEIAAYKCVSINEPFFQGHFPGDRFMPGVLIIEAMAQAGGLMVLEQFPPEELENKLFLFSAIENAKFRRPVRPGDRLDLRCRLLRQKFKVWRIEGKAYVDEQLVAEAELSAAVTERGNRA